MNMGNVKPCESLLIFRDAAEARTYRYEAGCGGWIFAPDDDGKTGTVSWKGAVIFPPHLTPSDIFNHPMTRGRSGSLIGSS